MTSPSWERVEFLFSAAQALPVQEREAWLARECGDDRALAAEVRSLLAMESVPDGLLTADTAGGARGLAALAGPATLVGGTEFGPYMVNRLLGAGGMGEVYLAQDSRLQRPVALKLLAGWLEGNPDLIQRFFQEALAASALNHPNIPVVYETGVVAGRHFIASEFVDGTTLTERLREGPLPWREALQIAMQVGEALHAAHATGIIHRDIKPGNILLGADGRARLVDFGIAKVAGRQVRLEKSVSKETRFGIVLGTPGYMAPEQAQGLRVDPRSDLWSLAAVLHEMLTGRTVGLDGKSLARSPPLPRALLGMLRKGLQAAPEARYQSARLFVDAIRRGEARASLPRRSLPWALATLLGMGIAVAATLWLRPAPAPSPDGQVPALLVLRFDSSGASESDQWFGDGLRDEVLSHLGRISGLRVLAGRTASALPTRPDNLPGLAAKFDVSAVLEGRVRVEGEHVQVQVQLLDARRDLPLWSDSYVRERREIFAVERDIAERVAARLKAPLLPEERASVEVPETANPEAHAELLKGAFFLARRDEASLRRAVDSFQRAIALDPGYALAEAQLAITLENLADYLSGAELLRTRAQARTAAQAAVRLAPRLAEGHIALGWAFCYWDWDLVGAAHEFDLAGQLAPNSARARNALGTLYGLLGQYDRAAAQMRAARRLDPVSSGFAANLAQIESALGREDEAEKLFRESLELESATVGSHARLALMLMQKGALEAAGREARLEPEPGMRDFALTVLEVHGASRAAADAVLKRFTAQHQDADPVLIAALHAYRGDRDAAFAWLDRAYDARDPGVIELMLQPAFRPLQSDPRFAAFRAKLGIPAPAA